jgi:hypothetical protein
MGEVAKLAIPDPCPVDAIARLVGPGGGAHLHLLNTSMGPPALAIPLTSPPSGNMTSIRLLKKELRQQMRKTLSELSSESLARQSMDSVGIG